MKVSELSASREPILGVERDLVKTPEDRRNDGTENEIDGEAAIKLYDELVKSPEDRLALEKEGGRSVGVRNHQSDVVTGHTRLVDL